MDILELIKIKESNDLFYCLKSKNTDHSGRSKPFFIPSNGDYKIMNFIWSSDVPNLYGMVLLDGIVYLNHNDENYRLTFNTKRFLNVKVFEAGKPVKDINIVSKNAHQRLEIDISKITFDSFLKEKYNAYE